MIFSRATVADVQRALTRLRKAIAKTDFHGPNGRLEVTVSIGAAQAAGEETLERIVERADTAMYASKAAGRNCCHWHDGKKIALIAEEGKKAAPPPLRKKRQGVRHGFQPVSLGLPTCRRAAQAGQVRATGRLRRNGDAGRRPARAVEPHGLLPTRPHADGRVEARRPDAGAGAGGDRRLQVPHPRPRPQGPRPLGGQPRALCLCQRPRDGHGCPLQCGMSGLFVAGREACRRLPRGRADPRLGQPVELSSSTARTSATR